MAAVASAPSGERTVSGPAPNEASSTAASAQPAARTAADVGGPATSTSSTSSPGAAAAMASAIPGVRATRTTPVPSARTPAAIGGRFGPQRTASSRANRTRTGRPCSSARRRATAPTSLVALPPNAPPLASGVAGSPPGTHHDASVSR